MLSRVHLEQALVWGCIALPWLALGYGVRFSLFGLPTTALELALVGLFGVFTFARGIKGWQVAWRDLPYRWLWLAWVLVGLVGAFVSPVFLKGLGVWRAFVLEPVLALVLVQAVLREASQRRALVMSLFGASLFVSMWALAQFVTGYGLREPWQNVGWMDRRATGPFSYPNAVALFVAPIAALAGVYTLRLLGEEKRWLKAHISQVFLSVATAVLGLAACFAVKSDGGMIALIAAWGIALLAYRWGRWFVGAGVVMAGTALALLPTLADALWKNLTFQGWSGRVRVWMWTDTLAMLREHWLLGAGLSGYPVVFDAFHTKRFIEIFQYPHQILLTAWSEVGLVGLMLFLVLLGTWAWRAWVGSRVFVGWVIGVAPLIAIVVHGLVDVPYWKNDLAVVFVLLWWLAGCLFEDFERKKADG